MCRVDHAKVRKLFGKEDMMHSVYRCKVISPWQSLWKLPSLAWKGTHSCSVNAGRLRVGRHCPLHAAKTRGRDSTSFKCSLIWSFVDKSSISRKKNRSSNDRVKKPDNKFFLNIITKWKKGRGKCANGEERSTLQKAKINYWEKIQVYFSMIRKG